MTDPGLEPPYGERDASGMAARIDAIPDQIGAALEAGLTDPWRPPVTSPDLLAVGALGGSAITADLTAELFFDALPHPLIAVREYHWPSCVGPRSLALLASYSGNTEETLALYSEAGRRSIPRLALTTGGTLAQWCERDGVPLVKLPPGSPPRAAMYASWVRLTRLVHAIDWIADPTDGWNEARARLAVLRETLGTRAPESGNRAKQMARALHGRPLFLYAGSARLAGLATRIRNQINENAKLLAHSALVPELNHNEIVGWEAPAPWNHNAAVLMLHDPEDPAEVRTRLSLTAEYVRGRGAEVFELEEQKGTRITRAAALAQFGDYLSLYLALLGGTDPTPIASIDWFKSRLAQSRKP